MIVVKALAETLKISDTAIRELVQKRITDLGGDAFDTDAIGYFFLVVEPRDTIEAIHAQVGFNILHTRFTGIRFNATGFTPSWELIEEFPDCYDMVFILSDDGYGVELFVSKEDGIDSDLIAMCQRYAFRQDAP